MSRGIRAEKCARCTFSLGLLSLRGHRSLWSEVVTLVVHVEEI